MFSQLRAAVLAVLRQPGIALVAVLALGLGVGLPASLFSIARGMALRGLPVEGGRDIMHLERRPVGRSGEGWGALPRDFLAWREQQRSFEGLAAVDFRSVALRVGSSTDRRSAAALSANAFELLRVSAELGRTFEAGDDAPGAEPVAILGYDLWTDRFAGDPGAVGQTVFIDGRAHTVIGVMPDGFAFPINEELWVPMVIPPAAVADPGFPAFNVFGRLADGSSRSDAVAEFGLIAGRLARQYPGTNENMEVTVKPYTERHTGETPMATLRVMLAAVMLVLVVACVNVANLLLVRAVHRMRALAVRAALGASRRTILVQLLLESMVLAVAGGALGVLIAVASSEAMSSAFAGRLPYWADMRLDAATLLYVLVISLAAGLLAGVLPAVKAMGADVVTTLKDEARGSSGLRIGRIMHGLVIVQIALSLGLLVVTGLMVASVRNVKDVEFGFPADGTVTARITLPESLDEDGRNRFLADLESRLTGNPGISTVAIASSLPATRAGYGRYALDGREYADPDEMPPVRRVAVSTDFFRTFGTAPVRGRAFDTRDGADGSPVAIVNERFVATALAGESALGRQIRFRTDPEGQWRTIVGVVPDLWVGGLDASGDRNPAGVYVPLAQALPLTFSVAAVARADAAAAARSIRDASAAIDPDVPVYSTRTMSEVIVDNSWFYGLGLVIVGVCGATTLVLAAIGLYGVIAFSVGRRTREFGIRMAIGASPAAIVSLVLRRGATQVALGMALGFALAWVIARGVASLLFMVSPSEPSIFASYGLFLALVTFGASFVPALRASRVDPLDALRTE